MNRSFLHFAYHKDLKTDKTADDYADEIDQCIRDMIKNEKTSGTLIIDIPEDLSEDEAMKFIEQITKRFLDNQDKSDE